MSKFKNYLSVSEVFYSLQGEGSTMGIPSVFLRLAGCNLLCGAIQDKELHGAATWRCDTIEVWMKGNKKFFNEVLSEEFVDHLKQGAHLVITGGEPLLQQQEILDYLLWFYQRYKFFPFLEIETNATIKPLPYLDIHVNRWNCSPKLSTSGMLVFRRYKYEVLLEFSRHVGNGSDRFSIFKFVITGQKDWDEIENDYLKTGLIQDRKKIWLMPAAESRKELIEINDVVAKIALEQGVNFSTRLQVEIWNRTTGV